MSNSTNGRLRALLTICSLLLVSAAVSAQSLEDTEILLVTAHPDDEAMFAGSVYRITRELGGSVDLALLTDGAGGYRYSTLAEPIYGKRLTDPDVAREYLPAIRKKELLAGGAIIGLRKYYFMEQPDTGRMSDPDSVLSVVWDSTYALARMSAILSAGDYDFVFVFVPRSDTHGHHKAASILALRAASRIVEDRRPVVLGAWISSSKDTTSVFEFDGLPGYPESATTSGRSSFRFNRSHPIEGSDRLNYNIPANWLIAEHKSQGTMQLLVNVGDVEEYWVFALNPHDAHQRASVFFDKLNDFGSTVASE